MVAKKTSPQKKKKQKKKSSVRKKKKKQFILPLWVHYFLFGILACVFFLAFYYFFISPYKYRWQKCMGIRAYGVCIPVGNYIYGIDVSRHQGAIEWDKVSETQSSEVPLDFVFIKATEGGDFKDENFDKNFQSAKEKNMIRGVYHYYIPYTPAKKQANFFIDNVDLQLGDLPPVLDVEVKPKNMTSEALQDSVKIWLDVIEKHYKVKPILYTSYKFKSKHLSQIHFDQYPYWIAHYYVSSVRYEGDWMFWQYTDVGIIPGIKELVDLNVFNGTKEELLHLTIR